MLPEEPGERVVQEDVVPDAQELLNSPKQDLISEKKTQFA
jgi:hypothetical protein